MKMMRKKKSFSSLKVMTLNNNCRDILWKNLKIIGNKMSFKIMRNKEKKMRNKSMN